MQRTRADVLDALAELRTIFTPPKGSDAPHEMAKRWDGALRDVTTEELRWAVATYIEQEDRFWPRPATMLKLVRERRSRAPRGITPETSYWDWERTKGDGAPCPVCGSVVEQRGDRINVWHDHQRHMETRVPYVGPRTGPVDGRGRMKPTTWQPGAAA